jgi:hypothetical protein
MTFGEGSGFGSQMGGQGNFGSFNQSLQGGSGGTSSLSNRPRAIKG